MGIRWDLHREVLAEIGDALKYAAPRMAALLFIAVALIASALLIGPLGMVAVIVLLVFSIWYWAEYHEAMRRDELRKRTNGMCG